MAGGVGKGPEILLRTGIRGMNDENIPARHFLEAFARLEHRQGAGEPPHIEFLLHGRNDTRQGPASPAPDARSFSRQRRRGKGRPGACMMKVRHNSRYSARVF